MVFLDKVSLYSFGAYLGTHFLDEAGLKLKDPPASVSQCWVYSHALPLPN